MRIKWGNVTTKNSQTIETKDLHTVEGPDESPYGTSVLK